MDAYDSWLFYERRFLRFERYGRADEDRSWDSRWVLTDRETGRAFDWVMCANAGGRYHGLDTPLPSTRAAVILSAAGCDWTERAP